MTKGLLYRGGLTTKTSARLAGAIMREFGSEDGGVVLDWLITRIQYADGLYERAVSVADSIGRSQATAWEGCTWCNGNKADCDCGEHTEAQSQAAATKKKGKRK